MDDRLMEKLLRETRFYVRKNQQLERTLEESRFEVSEARANLDRLKRDLRRIEQILEVLSYDRR